LGAIYPNILSSNRHDSRLAHFTEGGGCGFSLDAQLFGNHYVRSILHRIFFRMTQQEFREQRS
jgi:hypothetical protein